MDREQGLFRRMGERYDFVGSGNHSWAQPQLIRKVSQDTRLYTRATVQLFNVLQTAWSAGIS